jgi:formylglycine-generating enzyme required for sulfatase activity
MKRAFVNRGDILTGFMLCPGIPRDLVASLCLYRANDDDRRPKGGAPPESKVPPPVPRVPLPEAVLTPPQKVIPAHGEAERFSFWIPEVMKIDASAEARLSRSSPPEIDGVAPLTNDDFLSASEDGPLPGRPLVGWPRMWPFLRAVLGRRRQGMRPDVPRVVRALARGQALVRIPRHPRFSWQPTVHILLDRRSELAVFWNDCNYLIGRLQRIIGKGALRISDVEVGEREGASAGLQYAPPITDGDNWGYKPLSTQVAGRVVLVLGDLGQYSNRDSSDQWLQFGRRLKNRGASAWALCPCPRTQWLSDMTDAWKMACWDRGEQLPLRGRGLRAERIEELKRQSDNVAARQRLLILCSPAVRVEVGLLRDLRFLLPSSVANVGTEFALFQEFALDHRGFTLRADEVANYRKKLNQLDDATLKLAVSTMRRHHKYEDHIFGCMEVLGLKGFLPSERFEVLIDSGVMPADAVDEAMKRLWGVVAACWKSDAGFMAEETAAFHLTDADRQSPAMRTTLLPLQAFWALSKCGPGRQVPGWVRPADVARFTRNQDTLHRRNVMLNGGLMPGGEGGFPLGWLLSGSGSVFATFYRTDEAEGAATTIECSWGQGLPKEEARGAKSIKLESGGTSLTLQRVLMPGWAARMGYDREGPWVDLRDGPSLHWELRKGPGSTVNTSQQFFGGFYSNSETCWADSISRDQFGWFATFYLGGVEFVFRWIPPGTFMMGSREEEVGSDVSERPQHPVTISRGFWLGETPVTEAQRSAIVRETPSPGRSGLAEALSKLELGKETHPVNDVTWKDATAVAEALNAIMAARIPEQFRFTLPSEAQWEYACRAGTTTAFNDGSDCTVPDGKDPALDRLGSFSANSGLGVHPVRQKQPNAWGLYDMHGNVWEWCRDGFDGATYAKRARTEVVDPEVVPRGGAVRVVRGGSWGDNARFCRAAFRSRLIPYRDWNVNGLRLSAGQEPERQEGAGRKGGSRG